MGVFDRFMDKSYDARAAVMVILFVSLSRMLLECGILQGQTEVVSARCPGTKKILGGGWSVHGCYAQDPDDPNYYTDCGKLDDADYAVEASYPENENTWSVLVTNTGDVDIEVDLQSP